VLTCWRLGNQPQLLMERGGRPPLASPSVANPSEVVEQYLKAVVSHDWDSFSECLAEDIVRIGPFGDTYTPKAPYVEYISKLMPSLGGYSMQVDQIVESGDVVLAQLTETVEIGGTVHVTPEALVFTFDANGLISKIDIFIKRLGDAPKIS